MDKLTFCKRVALWTAVIAAVIITVIGLTCGQVIEGSLFGEIAKWFVVGLGIIGILEVFVYILAPGIYEDTIGKKKERNEK